MSQITMTDKTKPEPIRTITHDVDLGFSIVCDYTPRSCFVEFVVYDLEGLPVDGSPPMWHKKGSQCYPDPVESLEEADVFLHGSVKWDGCSNWSIDENDRGMLHGCSRADLTRLGEVLGKCWDMAKAILDADAENPDPSPAQPTSATTLPVPDPLFEGFSDIAPPPSPPEWAKHLSDDDWTLSPDARGRWTAWGMDDKATIVIIAKDGSFTVSVPGPVEDRPLEIEGIATVRDCLVFAEQRARELSECPPEDTAEIWADAADFAVYLIKRLDEASNPPQV